MTYFLRNGNTYRVTDEAAVDISRILPPANYIVKIDQYGNHFLEMTDSFPEPGKVYGDTLKNAERILNTFLARTPSTGVLLTGEKGSGKTLLAKQLGIDCHKIGIPVLLVNTPFCGDTFNKFIQDIEQPCMVLFDEFEKIYDSEAQPMMLTLLDGVYPSQKLFVLTCNDKWRIDQHMRNRPGRIFYMLEFNGLDVNFIREYCEDKLDEKSHIDSVCTLSALFDKFNFDMLKALVEEMNRYKETPQDAMRMLNSKPEYSERSVFEMSLIVDGELIEGARMSETRWSGNPLGAVANVSYMAGIAVNDNKKRKGKQRVTATAANIDNLVQLDWDEIDDRGEAIWKTVKFTSSDLAKVDAEKGSFIFKKDNASLTLTRYVESKFDYHSSKVF